jgi:hypothetical protein
MRALTVRQVWAWAIIYAGKDIENRSWPTRLRGTIAIHAAKGLTRAEYEEGVRCLPRHYRKEVPAFEDISRGAIIGVVDLVDCVTKSKSRWFDGAYGFVLRNPRPIKPIECSGSLGFWKLPPDIERRIKRLS